MKSNRLIIGLILGTIAGVAISNYKSPAKKRKEIIDFFSRVRPEFSTDIFTEMTNKEIVYYHQYLFDYFFKQLAIPENSKLFFEIKAILEKYDLEEL